MQQLNQQFAHDSMKRVRPVFSQGSLFTESQNSLAVDAPSNFKTTLTNTNIGLHLPPPLEGNSRTSANQGAPFKDLKSMFIKHTLKTSPTLTFTLPTQIRTLQQQVPDKEMPQVLLHRVKRGTAETSPFLNQDFKSPRLLKSPRILFPLPPCDKSGETENKVMTSENSTRATSHFKRNFGDFSSDKIEPRALSINTGITNSSCQRNVFAGHGSAEMEGEDSKIQFNQPSQIPGLDSPWSVSDDDRISTPVFKRQKLDHGPDYSKMWSPSVYQRWLKRDSIFAGKFSNGTTPIQYKPLAAPVGQQTFSELSQEKKFEASPSKSQFFSLFCPQKQHFTHLAAEPSQLSNPFKKIAPQVLSRTHSEQFSETKQIPDTPFVEHKFFGMHQEETILQSNEDGSFGVGQPRSRFQEDYQELQILGKGQFGRVVRCQNKLDQLEYAIKITHKKFRNSYEKTNFLSEIYALSALSIGSENPYVVRYYSGWIENSNLYIVMELCKSSLRGYAHKKRVKEGQSLTEEHLKQIMRDVCLGLQELHSRGIVHLDIKPENILESFSGKFKLGDLGMSRLLSKVVEEHDVPEGDCRYLARELLNDDPDLPIPDLTKADIFALGITCYELIEEKSLEKNGDQWKDLRESRVAFSDQVKDRYSQELLNTIIQMLDPVPELRPSPKDLLDNLLQSHQEKELRNLREENIKLKERMEQLEGVLQRMGYSDAAASLALTTQ